MNALTAKVRKDHDAGVTGSCEPQTWVLGTKPRSSARAIHTLKAEPPLQP